MKGRKQSDKEQIVAQIKEAARLYKQHLVGKTFLEVSTLAAAACFILEEIRTESRSYQFGTTDLHFTLCMNKEVDDRGAEVGSCFVVQSLRDEDCVAKSKNVYTVTHILSKQNDQKLYTDLIYMDRASSRADLPAEVRRRMTPDAR